VIVTAATRLPATVGLNVTLIVQLLPAATLAPHVLPCAKSPAFVPVTPMLDIASGLPPLLLSVTVCAALVLPTDCVPKLKLLAERLTVGGVATPVPVSETVCGLPVASSVIVTAATRLPAAVGLNVTLIVQLAPPATLAPHVFVSEKSPAFVPVIAMLVIDNGPPLLLSVTVCAALVLPTD
jgi:hypothetical protein